MARGGELLYLQLLNLFNSERAAALGALWKQPEYAHLFEGQANITNVLRELCCSLSSNLIELMAELDDSLGLIASFISTAMHDLDETRLRAAPAHCGWVPKESLPEAILFAWEMNNVCSAQIDALEKVQILQTMCTVQVLRSLCFQAARHHGHNNSNLSFMGNYAWVIFAGDKVEGDVRKLAAHNYEAVEKLILYAIQSGDHRTTLTGRADIKADAQEDSNLLFRKRGKDLGLIVPPTGSPMRFFLPEHILRMLVTGLIPPGTRMRLDQFESRLFHHYGMAISGLHLREAAEWTNPELPEKTVWTETGWLADSLNSAGFLIPLSDAISIVQNPFGA
jgi:hypothetical protein